MKLKIAITALTALLAVATQADNRQTLIDHGWKFRYGAVSGAEQADYDDSAWRQIDLPHDWSVETEAAEAEGGEHVGPFSKRSPGKRDTGWTLGGEGWYRRTFTLSEADADRLVSLYFEGVFNQAEVWVNGQLACTNHYGYQPFRTDITHLCRKPGETNVIAVKAVNKGHNSRWYTGSGIYRHVWLEKTPRLHLAPWETYVTHSSLPSPHSSLNITAHALVANASDTEQSVSVAAEIFDKAGKRIAKAQTKFKMQPRDSQLVAIPLTIASPTPWTPDSPTLYRAVVKMKGKKKTTDQQQISFGLRTTEFSAERGFLLNGEPLLMRGGCVHHDNGLLGAAAFDRAEDRKLALLKQAGYNAVRCSHNLPSEHFLDACDSLGLLVIDEAFDQWLVAKNPDDYHNDFKTHFLQDIATMVRRDRRHPSVVMWSLGNEIPGRIEPEGMEAARQMREAILALDTTRAITAAICEWDTYSHTWADYDAKAFQSLDVGGYNYLYDKYEADHQTHPRRVMYGSESYPKRAAENWAKVEQLPYVVGDFTWTAMDYLGEGGIGNAGPRKKGYGNNGYGWPWTGGWCGDIDLIGEKKPQSYYRDIVWRRRPIAMAVERPTKDDIKISPWGWQLEEQRWTYDGYRDNQLFTINVYSRAPKVRLYLNDRLVGEKPTSDTFHADFLLPYAPGTLRAVELYGAREGEAFELRTAGQPTALRLKADRTTITADGQDLAYITIELTDSLGQVVPDNSRKVSIAYQGDGQLIATGNASPTDMESFRSPTPRLHNGRAMAIVRAPRHAGEATLTVSSDALESKATIHFGND